MSRALRRLLKLPITVPLQFEFIRRRVAYELRSSFEEMKFEIPLTEHLACPIGHWDAVHSFSEIFVTNEYGPFLEHAPLPRRWIDLGCHAGYFTLYLAWKNALAGRADEWSALLIDADPRVAAQTAWTLRRNHLDRQASSRTGAIGDGSGDMEFALRDGMGSSREVRNGDAVCRVPSIGAGEIASLFPPPYDLIKIDIEGAEYDFLRNYGELACHASHLLVEWHSNDRDGSGERELRALCAGNKFRCVAEIRERREVQVNGSWHSSGVQLYARE